MSLQETVLIDKIEVYQNGIVSVRECTTITKDGAFFANRFHRRTLVPGQDLTGQPDRVVAQCQAAWTPDVIAAYQAHISAPRI